MKNIFRKKEKNKLNFKFLTEKKEAVKGLTIGLVLGSIIFSGIGVVAVTLAANQVTYTPSDQSFTATNVKDALDQMYVLANSSSTPTLNQIGEGEYSKDKTVCGNDANDKAIGHCYVYDLTSYSGYGSMTADNFLPVITSIATASCKSNNESGGSVAVTSTAKITGGDINKKYDPATGTLIVYPAKLPLSVSGKVNGSTTSEVTYAVYLLD